MVGNRTPITSTKLLIDVPIRKIGIKISNLILKGGSGSEKGQLSMPDYF
jgi:hypothetical protein